MRVPHYSDVGGMLSSFEHSAKYIYHCQDRVSSTLKFADWVYLI
jgi:hypothetical protein